MTSGPNKDCLNQKSIPFGFHSFWKSICFFYTVSCRIFAFSFRFLAFEVLNEEWLKHLTVDDGNDSICLLNKICDKKSL